MRIFRTWTGVALAVSALAACDPVSEAIDATDTVDVVVEAADDPEAVQEPCDQTEIIDTRAVLEAQVPEIVQQSTAVKNLASTTEDLNQSLPGQEMLQGAALFASESGSLIVAGERATAGVRYRATGVELTIGIPGADRAGQARVVGPGMIAYGDVAPQSEIVVQATADGTARLMAVLAGPQAPAAFRFDMWVPEGARLVVTDDGAVVVVDENDDGLATIAPPWARDAGGTALPARYTVEGDETLVLHVDHTNALYPVVADPAVTKNCSWGSCSYYLSRKVTRSITTPAGAVAIVSGLIPAIPAKAIAAIAALLALKANECKGKKQCLRIRTFHFGGPPLLYCDNGKHCKNH